MSLFRINLDSIVLSASLATVALVSFFSPQPSFAWENGGRTKNLADPKYGTHDWIAEEALVMLPEQERSWVDLRMFLLGTEAPDNQRIARRILGKQAARCYGDPFQHHTYFDEEGELLDDAACVRAQEEYDKARAALLAGDFRKASFFAGAGSHYEGDQLAWPHVMGFFSIHEGEELPEHTEFERSVEATLTARRMSDPEHRSTLFEPYIVFDGMLEQTTAYEATRRIALQTHRGFKYPCTEMQRLLPMGPRGNGAYVDATDWSPEYRDEVGAALNGAINGIADTLHSLYLETQAVPTTTVAPDPAVPLEMLTVQQSPQ